MNKGNSSIISFILTIILLILVEVITTTIFPLFGMSTIRFSFFTLLVLFLSFYKNTNWIVLHIIAFSYIHSIFSVETWYLSSFIGILTSIVVAYFSELIHLSNRLVTMFFVLIFQIGMMLFRSIVFYLRGNNFEYIFQNFMGHLFEIAFLTILAPFAFDILSIVWTIKTESIEEIG